MSSSALEVKPPSEVSEKEPLDQEHPEIQGTEQRPAVFIRFGAFMLIIADEQKPISVIMQELVAQLERDPRVISVRAPKLDEDWDEKKTYYPSGIHLDPDTLVEASDAFTAVALSRPIRFVVNVPKKNQPLFHLNDEIPAERYYAEWDGELLFVGWEGQVDDDYSMAGGHIVETVLRDIAREAGYGLYVQACSPSCDYMFAHTTIVATAGDDDDDLEYQVGPSFGEVDVVAPVEEHDPEEILSYVATTSS
jgi:hypothetical protein